MYNMPSGPAPANESLHRFLSNVFRRSSTLNVQVFPPSCVTAMSVREPSGVESSLTRNAVRAGSGRDGCPSSNVRAKGASPLGNLLSVAIATTMILLESFGFTNTQGSPAPRFGLPNNKYSSDIGAVAD